jgi:hypothetical protein
MTQTIVIWEKQPDEAKLFVIDDGYVTATIQNWLVCAQGTYAYATDWHNNMGLCFMNAATTAPEDILLLEEQWQPYCGWLIPFDHDKDIQLDNPDFSNLYQITLTT